MTFLQSKKSLLLAIFLAQMVLIFFTYVINPGRTAITLTAFQPDSINSVCIASQFSEKNKQFTQKVDSLIQYFNAKDEGFSCPEKYITTYKTRLTLPLLMLIFGQVGPWYFLLFPSIGIFLAIGFIYWRLTASYAVLSKPKFFLTLLPFLSPHISGHLANLMSEGPAVLGILLLLYLTNIDPKSWRAAQYVLIFVVMLFGLASRQIWPIISIILIHFANHDLQETRRMFRIPIKVVIAFTPLLMSKIIEILSSSFLKSYGEAEWRISILVERPFDAIEGLFSGITDDLLHVLRFADFAFLAFIFLLITSLRKMNQRSFSIFAVCICWGLATTSFVYLADGSYGQNFRFLVFGFFLAPVLLAQQEGASKSE